jgi:transitional endoplasmic reticulum ATPase
MSENEYRHEASMSESQASLRSSNHEAYKPSMSGSQVSFRSSSDEGVYKAFRQNQSGSSISTELAVLEFLRNAYPDHNTTMVSRAWWDFIGFAAAGLAECNIDTENDTYNAVRAYQKAPGPRLGQEAGLLRDTVKYGRWNYTWHDHEYMIYEIVYETRSGGSQDSLFILNSHTDEEANESDVTLIDQLMIAVGEWSCALHNDIYIFDNERWHKSPELWKSIQGSTWEDVILSPDMKSSLIEDVTGFFENKDLYKKLAVPWKRGVILHGVP